jgi:CRP-like cAMP-binding protein
VAKPGDSASLIFLFPENEVLDHLPLLEPLSPSEKANLNAKISRRYFQAGERLLRQDEESGSVRFVYSGVIQATREVQDGRTVKAGRLGPGDTFGEISLLTGIRASVTLEALTSGLLLESKSEDLKPILEARPELVESLSHYAAGMQQFLSTLDKTAIEPEIIEQHDIRWRIKNFFHLELEELQHTE